MGKNIFSRMKDVVVGGISENLDKLETPSVKAGNAVRSLDAEMNRLKVATADSMNNVTRIKRELSEVDENIKEMEEFTRKAHAANEEGDALIFAEKVVMLTDEKATKESLLALNIENTEKLKELYSKTLNELSVSKYKKSTIAANEAIVRVRTSSNKLNTSNPLSVTNTLDSILSDTQDRLGQLDAMEQLDAETTTSIDSLKGKYATKTTAQEELDRILG